MKRIAQIAAVGALLAALATSPAQAANVTVKNNCGYQIALGVYPPVWNNGGGFLGAGASVTFGQWASGNGGRIWSRHNCTDPGGGQRDNCSSGMCGGSGIQCAGSTAAGVTEAEINFNAAGTDWYDISYVDGFNDMASIAPTNGAYAASCTGKPACTTVMGNGYGGSGDTCLSPCTAYNTDQYCCRNAFGTSASCNEFAWPAPGKNYVDGIHAVCNGEYTYAYDDAIGLHTTPTGPNYNVVFCPNGGGTGGSGGGGLTNGVHRLVPGCANGARLDDSNGGTGNGNKVQIWQADPNTKNQQWNFNNIGTNTWNMAVNLGPYCLRSSGTTSGSAVQIWACDGDPQESWVSGNAAQAGSFNFALKGYSLCLDVAGGLSANGTQVQVYTCNGTPAQQWTID